MRERFLGGGAMLMLFLLMGGCTSTSFQSGMRSDGNAKSLGGTCSLQLPQGWYYSAWESRDSSFTSSFSGMGKFETIYVSKDRLDKKKEALAELTIEERMDREAAELKDGEKYNELRIEELGAARLGGVEGYEIVYTFLEKDGVRCRRFSRTVFRDGYSYHFVYHAPERYYYERYLDQALEALDSFRFP